MSGGVASAERTQARAPIIQDRMRTLGDIPRVWSEVQPEAMAFQFEGRRTPYAAFDRHADQVAHGLAAAGIEPGARVAYLGKNSDHYFETLFGAARVGAVMTAINWRLADAEIAYILEDSRAEALFVGAEFVQRALALRQVQPNLKLLIAMDGGGGLESFEAWRDHQPPTPYPSAASPRDVVVQMYTSGTTGKPKGAMLSHDALLAIRRRQIEHAIAWARWTPDDVGLLATPVGHIAGTGWGVMSLFFGAASVVVSAFEAEQIFDYITRDRVSKMFLPPTAMLGVLRHPRAAATDYSRLKCMLYGASPIPKALLEEGMAVFGCGFAQQYGLTETSGAVVVLAPEDHLVDDGAKLRAAGKPLPDVEIRILDADGAELPTGEVGEIAVRSPGNMSGYWNLPEATAQVLSPDNWFRTGDAGYVDADGYLFIHDRVKDMIVSGGENVYPAEVENAIFGHPAVAEVAVIGVPDPKWGEAVKAIVVLREGRDAAPTEIIAWARERIAAFKAPKSVDFADSLPRNASGKILRRELRANYWAGQDRAVN